MHNNYSVCDFLKEIYDTKMFNNYLKNNSHLLNCEGKIVMLFNNFEIVMKILRVFIMPKFSFSIGYLNRYPMSSVGEI